MHPTQFVKFLIEDLEQDLVAALNAAGVEATYEYPGFVNVELPEGSLAIGTLNGFWSANIVTSDGGDHPLKDEEAFEAFYDIDPETVSMDQLVQAVQAQL